MVMLLHVRVPIKVVEHLKEFIYSIQLMEQIGQPLNIFIQMVQKVALEQRWA